MAVGIILHTGGFPWDSQAAEWSAEPSLGVKGQYNSNLILTSAPHKDVYGLWISPGVNFAGATENLEITGRAAADFVRYTGGSEQGLTNLYFPLSVKYRVGKETLKFDGGFTRDNTLMGELLQTGVVLGFTQRNLWHLAPSWTHAFTEQLSLQGTYNYSNAAYENGAQLGLLDYEVHGGSLALSYRLSEKNQLQVIGNYTNFSVPTANALRSDIAGGQLSITHSFTETITATLAGGPQLVASSIYSGPVRITDTQTVWIGNANLRKQWDNGYAQLVVSREILPSGFGLLVLTDRVSVTLSKDLTEQVTLSLNGQVSLASSLESNVAPNSLPENRYVNVTPRLTWKIDQWWAVDMTYTYGRRDVESLNDSAIANATTVMLTYYPPKLTVGR
jgi:hypothetical protein